MQGIVTSMQELSQTIVDMGAETNASGDSWHFEIDNHLAVDISCSASNERLILNATLGEPDPNAREPVLDFMAKFNGLADMTGPIAVSMDPKTGILSLSGWVYVIGLEVSAVETITADFAMRVMMLRRVAEDGDPDDELLKAEEIAIHSAEHEDYFIVRG